jgi:4-hydroxybenzoyl-CoA reductase subunit alpha
VLVAAAARKLEAKPEEIECLGELYRAGAQDKGLSFNEVVTEALKDTGTITVTGNYSTIPQSHGGKKYRGAAIGGTMGYSYSAQVVEVSVDEDTGVVTVDKVWVAHDCGKALNRLTVEGQVQGSVWMGMGQAMSEETAYHDGLLITGNMLDYRVPTIEDSPPIEVGIVESNDPHGPFGAKEAGEGSLAAFLPALTNAACSRRWRSAGARAMGMPAKRAARIHDRCDDRSAFLAKWHQRGRQARSAPSPACGGGVGRG